MFLFLVACRVSFYSKDTRMQRGEGSVSIGTSLTSPYSMSWVGIDISNDAPLYLLAEVNPLSQQQAWLFRGFQGITMANNSIECNTVPILEAWFGASPSPSLLGGLIRIIIIYFIKFPLY